MLTTDWNRVLACNGRESKVLRKMEKISNIPSKQTKIILLKKGEREIRNEIKEIQKELRRREREIEKLRRYKNVGI